MSIPTPIPTPTFKDLLEPGTRESLTVTREFPARLYTGNVLGPHRYCSNMCHEIRDDQYVLRRAHCDIKSPVLSLTRYKEIMDSLAPIVAGVNQSKFICAGQSLALPFKDHRVPLPGTIWHMYILEAPGIDETQVTEMVRKLCRSLKPKRVTKDVTSRTITLLMKECLDTLHPVVYEVLVHLELYRNISHLVKRMGSGGAMLAWDGMDLWTTEWSQASLQFSASLSADFGLWTSLAYVHHIESRDIRRTEESELHKTLQDAGSLDLPSFLNAARAYTDATGDVVLTEPYDVFGQYDDTQLRVEFDKVHQSLKAIANVLRGTFDITIRPLYDDLRGGRAREANGAINLILAPE